MKVLDQVPALLRGRGAPQCLALECDCKERFLWSKIATPEVICPSCRRAETITVDAPILNGQRT